MAAKHWTESWALPLVVIVVLVLGYIMWKQDHDWIEAHGGKRR
jgi:hypothetical protein